MTVNEMQIAFRNDAEKLGDYQSMTKTYLANGYCDADENAIKAKDNGDFDQAEEYERLRSAYYSALMLRYWYKIFEWQKNSFTLNLEPTDFVDWLSDSLYVAFYYRMWRYEYQAVVREGKFIEYKLDADGNKILNNYYYKIDPNAPDKVINRCCGSMRGRVFQFHNKDKRKADTQTYSLDLMLEEDGDYALNYTGAYVEDNRQYLDGAYSLVQMFLEKGESLEALIVDSIAYYDTYKTSKEINKIKDIDPETGNEIERKETRLINSFDSRKLVKHLNTIGEDFIYSFCNTYSVHNNIGTKIIKTLKELSNIKLYKVIEKTLEEIKQSPELLSCIR